MARYSNLSDCTIVCHPVPNQPLSLENASTSQQLVADVKVLCTYMQVDSDTVTGEDLDFSQDHVKTGGLFKHSKTATPLLLTSKMASRKLSANEVWHAGFILYGAYKAFDA